ncbi:MAG TPA: HEAT repeat domain-containing protein, partial [Chthoniobacteraceae bacterium]
RVPRVGSGVSPERTSDSATAAGESVASAPLQEVRDGGTPPPARGTRALPGASATGDTPLPRPAFTVEDGYQIELWAENPLLGKPTQMNWDAQGRLWVCSSSLYPQVAPGEAVNDKILILTDTDRDGRADKSEVFAEGLLIPTGVVPDLVRAAEGGQRTEDSREKTAPTPSPPVTSDLRPPSSSPAACYVAQSSELLHFTDTDGDGKADQRRVIFSGFGTEDTHHLIHTLRWGPDGRLYFNQSVYIHSHVETAWGMLRLNSGGVFAYDPRTERLEVFAKGLWNPWGHAWDDWGQSFLTDGAGSTGISWAFPGATFAPFEGSRRQMPSISPGSYPKFCGLELIKSPHFPADWQGNAITCDFRAHRIVRFRIEDLSVEKETATTQSPRRPEEISEPTSSASSAIAPVAPSRFQPRSGYTTKEMPDLVRTDDVNFRPIDVRLGPDGALYVADWSNPIIQHGEVDFRDPRRNKHAGRIWRISRKGAKAQSWEPLLGRTTDELLEKLLSESAWEKEQARLTLVAAINAAAPEGGITPPPSQIKRITAFMEAKTTSSFSLETVNLFAALPSSGPANWDGFKFLAAVQFAQNAKTVSNRAIGVRAAGLLLSKAIAADGAEHARQWALFGQGVNDFAEKRPLSIPADSLAARVLTKKEPMESLTEHNSLWLTSPVFNFASDPSPRVRLEAMRALSRIQTARSAELVLEAAVTQAPSLNVQQASSPQTLAGRADNQAGSLSYDRHFDFAAWQSINDLAKPWTDAIASGEWKIEGREAQLAWGLKAIDPVLAGATLSKLFAAEKVPLDGTGPWFEIIGAVGGPAELQPLWDSLLASYAGNCCDTDEVHALSGKVPHLYEPAARRALAAILEAARTRNVRPAERTHLATQLFHSFDALQLAAVELAARWQSPDAVAKLRELLDEAEVAVPLRRAAFQALGTLATPEAIATLKEWKKPETPALDRREGFLALAQHRFSDVAAELPRILQEVPSEAEALEVWRRLVQIKGAVELIANAVSPEMNAQLPKHVITAGIQAAREAGKSGSKLAEVLRPLPAPGLMETPASRSSLAARAQASGDPAAGELIYQRSALSCVMCHAIGGVGGNLGPDLTSLGASAPLNYIVESLIDPAAKVKEGYHAVALNLKDGTQASGIQARETPEEVILRNPAGGEQPVAKAQISSRTDLGSIMPAGLIDALPEKEQLDLVAFLGQLGKPGRFDASKGHVARIWRLHSGSDSAKVLRGPAGELPGIAAYTLIDGRLLKGALEESAELVPGSSATLLAVTQFDGNAQTSVQLTGATRAWLDGDLFWENGQAVTGKTPNAEGLHTLTVELPRSGFPEFLRAEVAGGRFLNR